jgi:hypothetical protein
MSALEFLNLFQRVGLLFRHAAAALEFLNLFQRVGLLFRHAPAALEFLNLFQRVGLLFRHALMGFHVFISLSMTMSMSDFPLIPLYFLLHVSSFVRSIFWLRVNTWFVWCLWNF